MLLKNSSISNLTGALLHKEYFLDNLFSSSRQLFSVKSFGKLTVQYTAQHQQQTDTVSSWVVNTVEYLAAKESDILCGYSGCIVDIGGDQNSAKSVNAVVALCLLDMHMGSHAKFICIHIYMNGHVFM